MSPSKKMSGEYKKSLLIGKEEPNKQRYDKDLIRKLYRCGFNAGDISKSGIAGLAGISRMNAYMTLYRDGTFDKYEGEHKVNRKKMKKLMRDLAISYMLDIGLNPDLVE